MANFERAYERTIANEGGYKLTDIPGDAGGQTYAGISRRANPGWPGWRYIDSSQIPPSDMVRNVYRTEYWDRVSGDQIVNQRIAESIYYFAVNAGWKVSAKLAQAVIGVTPDGVIGPRSIEAINKINPDTFHLAFALAKVKRYAEIVNRDKTQSKFLLGWINRTLKELA